MYEPLARQLEIHGDLMLEPEYYGRGMSNPTVAVTGSYPALLEAIAGLVDDLVNDSLACTTDEEKAAIREQYDELRLNSLSSLRVDNLGNDLIFY